MLNGQFEVCYWTPVIQKVFNYYYLELLSPIADMTSFNILSNFTTGVICTEPGDKTAYHIRILTINSLSITTEVTEMLLPANGRIRT